MKTPLEILESVRCQTDDLAIKASLKFVKNTFEYLKSHATWSQEYPETISIPNLITREICDWIARQRPMVLQSIYAAVIDHKIDLKCGGWLTIENAKKVGFFYQTHLMTDSYTLVNALKLNNLPKISSLLESSVIDVNRLIQLDDEPDEALSYLCHARSPEACQLLIQAGANLWSQVNFGKDENEKYIKTNVLDYRLKSKSYASEDTTTEWLMLEMSDSKYHSSETQKQAFQSKCLFNMLEDKINNYTPLKKSFMDSLPEDWREWRSESDLSIAQYFSLKFRIDDVTYILNSIGTSEEQIKEKLSEINKYGFCASHYRLMTDVYAKEYFGVRDPENAVCLFDSKAIKVMTSADSFRRFKEEIVRVQLMEKNRRPILPEFRREWSGVASKDINKGGIFQLIFHHCQLDLRKYETTVRMIQNSMNSVDNEVGLQEQLMYTHLTKIQNSSFLPICAYGFECGWGRAERQDTRIKADDHDIRDAKILRECLKNILLGMNQHDFEQKHEDVSKNVNYIQLFEKTLIRSPSVWSILKNELITLSHNKEMNEAFRMSAIDHRTQWNEIMACGDAILLRQESGLTDIGFGQATKKTMAL